MDWPGTSVGRRGPPRNPVIPAKAGIQGFDCLPFKTGGSRTVGRPRGGAAPAKPLNPSRAVKRPASRIPAKRRAGRMNASPTKEKSPPARRGRIYAPRCRPGDDARIGSQGQPPVVVLRRIFTPSIRNHPVGVVRERPAPSTERTIAGLSAHAVKTGGSRTAPTKPLPPPPGRRAHLPAFAVMGSSPECARIRREREEANAWASEGG